MNTQRSSQGPRSLFAVVSVGAPYSKKVIKHYMITPWCLIHVAPRFLSNKLSVCLLSLLALH